MWKTINYWIILSLGAATVISCTVDLDVDLNESDPQMVVEANLSDSEFGLVKLTRSINFDQENNFPEVSGALVQITSSDGASEMLVEIDPGVYSGSEILAAPQQKYTLSISFNDELIEGECYVPNSVSFDSLLVRDSSGSFGGPGGGNRGSEIVVFYSDPSSETNYYKFVEYKNGVFQGWYVFDDRLTNGIQNESVLRGGNRNLVDGDVVTVEMECIDQEVFDYYNSFGNLFGGPANSSTPANPYTNLSGTKLGYFSAHTLQVKEYTE